MIFIMEKQLANQFGDMILEFQEEGFLVQPKSGGFSSGGCGA
ncbi:hypothetical protein [Guggenheimella bovis]